MLENVCCWTLPCSASVGHSAPSAIFTCSCATSTPYTAAVTDGFSAMPTATAAFNVVGASRSTGEAGARFAGSTPMMRR